jgi:uncharacterized protein (DUF2141 family)
LAALHALLLAVAAPAPVPHAAPIEIVVEGVRSARGLVHVDVCTEAMFLKDCRWSADVPAVAGTTIVTVPDVPPGRYAVQAFHDANADHKVDRNLLGFPTERVGFSNDAPVHFAPPKFADAAFDHGSTPQRIGLTLRKLP